MLLAEMGQTGSGIVTLFGWAVTCYVNGLSPGCFSVVENVSSEPWGHALRLRKVAG